VSTPAVFADANHEPAPVGSAAAAALWNRLRPHRDISASLTISGLAHLALFLIFGATLYVSGLDDMNVPELSVQLVTREGPSSQEYTEAALPRPAPDPVEDVIPDPGTSTQTVDAPAISDSTPVVEQTPDEVTPATFTEAYAQSPPPSAAALITTTGESSNIVAMVTEPKPDVTVMPQPEQVMLTKSVQKLAQQLLDTNMMNAELSWSQDGRQYSARVTRQPAPDSTGLEQVVAEIMTENDGKRMKTRLSLKRLAFSHFTQLVNFWDPDIRLHDDIIDGRFHSNTEIGLAFSGGIEPRFFGKVTTSAAKVTVEPVLRRRNRDVFQGGFETRTEKVLLPRDMPDVVAGGDERDRRVFSGDTRILFNSDGSYVWRAANGEGPLERAEASDRPRYLIAEKGAKLLVAGTVSGIFTVYSPSDIEIENDLVYAHDPRDSLLSRDFLALIAGRDIKVATAQVTGVGDLHVHAAMFARRRFTIESADKAKPGTLYMLGSLTAGTILETEPRYATKMDFDKRFEYLRPANFPMTRRYEVDSWDQGWEEVEHPERAAEGLAKTE
jgi:hypothetical protein